MLNLTKGNNLLPQHQSSVVVRCFHILPLIPWLPSSYSYNIFLPNFSNDSWLEMFLKLYEEQATKLNLKKPWMIVLKLKMQARQRFDAEEMNNEALVEEEVQPFETVGQNKVVCLRFSCQIC